MTITDGQLTPSETRTVEDLRREMAVLRNDLMIIASELYDEALRRDWCSEYDSYCDLVNARTSQRWLTPCREEVDLTFTVRIQGTSRSEDDFMAELKHELTRLTSIDRWNADYGSIDQVDVS